MIEVNLQSNTEVEVLTNVANRLTDLVDVNATGITSTAYNYVLAYDTTSNKFAFIDPDDVLVSAASTVQSATSAGDGLPGEFINSLDTSPLRSDNIDLDGGSF
jgi:hypothetical protein